MTVPYTPRRWSTGLVAAALLGVTCVPLVARSAYRDALRSADAARAEHLSVQSQVLEVGRLRARRESIADHQRPTGELVEPFKAMLHSAGIAPSALTHVSSPDPQPISGSALFRQQFAVTIERIRVQDLVRVLARWRSSQSLWTPRSIRLELPSATGGRAGSIAADDRYTVFVTFENVFIAGTPGPSRATPDPGQKTPPRIMTSSGTP